MNRGKRVERKCKFCGSLIFPREADVKRGWGKYCNKTCKAKEQERRTGQFQNYLYKTYTQFLGGIERDCDTHEGWDEHK